MLSRLQRVADLRSKPFNRKIILGDANATHWFGRRLNWLTLYRFRNEFEMHSWVQSVSNARRYGQELGEHRYLELRYEDMCREPVKTVGRAFAFAHLEMRPEVEEFLRANARVDRICKWQTLPTRKTAGAINIGRLLLEELGYLRVPAETRTDWSDELTQLRLHAHAGKPSKPQARVA